MNEKHNIFHGQFMLNDVGAFVPATQATAEKFRLFKESLVPYQKVDTFMESNVDNGTVPQLAKIHACIRELGKHLGYSFQDMKFEIKRLSGLCVEKEINGNKFLICKSFGDCSVDELAMVIQAVIELGDENNMNFR